MKVSFIGYVLVAILAHLVWSELICNPFQGMCEGIFLKLEMHVNTRKDCAEVCRQTSDCTWFSFDEESRLCFAMETCIKEDTDYQRFYSAPVVLESDCKCGILAHCDRGHLVEYFNISSPVDCLHQCHIDSEQDCNWMTYNVENGACFLFSQCSYGFNVTYPYSITAHKSCSMNSIPDENNLDELKQKLGLVPQITTEETLGDYSYYEFNDVDILNGTREKREAAVNGVEKLNVDHFLQEISNNSLDSLLNSPMDSSLSTISNDNTGDVSNPTIPTLSSVPTLVDNKEVTETTTEENNETDDSDNDLLLRIIFKK